MKLTQDIKLEKTNMDLILVRLNDLSVSFEEFSEYHKEMDENCTLETIQDIKEQIQNLLYLSLMEKGKQNDK